MNEVCSVLTRKAKSSEPQIKQIIESFYDRCAVIELDADTLFNASDLRDRYGFSFWDGLIVASALSTSAEIFYSEDMQDGLIVDRQLAIDNPFK